MMDFGGADVTRKTFPQKINCIAVTIIHMDTGSSHFQLHTWRSNQLGEIKFAIGIKLLSEFGAKKTISANHLIHAFVDDHQVIAFEIIIVDIQTMIGFSSLPLANEDLMSEFENSQKFGR